MIRAHGSIWCRGSLAERLIASPDEDAEIEQAWAVEVERLLSPYHRQPRTWRTLAT